MSPFDASAAAASSGEQVRHAIAAADRRTAPFRHWLLADVLPARLATALIDLPFPAPMVGDTAGRRETHNATRRFFTEAERAAFPACAELAGAFQDRATTALIEATCGIPLTGTFLRIEHCQDTDGFWLEPHTDIAAKLFTMLVYLSTDPDAENWGTDLLDGPERCVGRASGRFNSGLIFIPAADTWHGFAPRPIGSIRRSIIINYVVPGWRSRHELAFPDQPVARA